MSLVGNLEDLSLGDILQIISLSQKSGVLSLAGDQGSGRIVFRQGLVEAACLKGHPNDLRELLVGGGLIDPAGYDASLARSGDLDVSLEQTLASEAGLAPEQIEELIRGAAEAAILEMFSWPAGDFSFDVRSELEPDDPQLILPNGINAQYLAMEGLRLRDERDRDATEELAPVLDPETESSSPDASATPDPIFGSDPLEVDTDPGYLDAPLEITDPVIELDPADTDLAAVDLDLDDCEPDSLSIAVDAERVEVALEQAEAPAIDGIESATDTLVACVIERADGDADAVTAGLDVDVEEPATSLPPAAPASPTPTAGTGAVPRRRAEDSPQVESAKKMPVVLIDPDVTVLEWVKAAIGRDFARIHVFQQADQGLARIRQYLIRGETPLVLISPDTQIDPLSGIHGLGDFIKRLKVQAPRLVVLGLREDDDTEPTAMPASLNGVLRRPPRSLLAERNQQGSAMASQVLSRALLELLAQQEPGSGMASGPSASANLRNLRDTTAKLQEASSRGEILPVVLDFAADLFARVAILIVRDDEVFAVAGRGIPTLEVDPLESSPPITLPTLEAGWIRKTLDSRKPHVGAPATQADRSLLESFGGGQEPNEVYLGPIESGNSVIALLYADQATTGEPLPDSSGLEVVLHHAGLALDRAALERALWEADAEDA